MAVEIQVVIAMDRIAAVVDHLAPALAPALAPSPVAARDAVRVCVTGAAGQIAYSLLPMIANGCMFGENTPVILHMLDIPPMLNALQGVKMEIDDCAFPLLKEVIATVEPEVAFNQVDAAILVGAFPRRKGMLRKDLLEKNAAIFEAQGKVIDRFARKDVKVLVVGNPANTNALICMENAPSIPRENFTALTRLDLNRAKAQIALKANVPVSAVQNVIIWGNHSSTQYPDVSHAVVRDAPLPGSCLPVASVVADDQWLRSEFIRTIQQRGAAVIKARGLSSAASAANAVVAHMRAWWCGTAPGEAVSMGVAASGLEYGVGAGLIYSMPVSCVRGTWAIVPDLKIDAFSREKMDITEKELQQERDTAFAFLKSRSAQ